MADTIAEELQLKERIIEGERVIFRYDPLPDQTMPIKGSVAPLREIVEKNSPNEHLVDLEVKDIPENALIRVLMPAGYTFFQPITNESELENAKKSFKRNFEGDSEKDILFVKLSPQSEEKQVDLKFITPNQVKIQKDLNK